MSESDYRFNFDLKISCSSRCATAEYCIINYIILYDVRVYINCMLKVELFSSTVSDSIIIYLIVQYTVIHALPLVDS